jgi:hypothetical protein
MGLPSANSLTGYDARLLLGVRGRGETFIPWVHERPHCSRRRSWLRLTSSLNSLRLDVASGLCDVPCRFTGLQDCAHCPGDVRRGTQMETHDDDIPVAYLVFTVAAIIAIGVTAAGAFIMLIRS